MRVGVARTVALEGLSPRVVTVEARVTQGLPGFTLIGVTGGSSIHASERVRAALSSSGHSVGQVKVLVNLAPADVRKSGARFDLPIAVAVLRALEVVDPGEDTLLGELSLSGKVRPVTGVLPSLLPAGALGHGSRGHGSQSSSQDAVVVPWQNRHEARLAGDRAVLAVRTLREYVDVAIGQEQPASIDLPERRAGLIALPDMGDVAGQPEARRALEIAAAGGHHVLMIGPPGAGKSMLARRLPGILPRLENTEALVAASVASLSGRARTFDRLDTAPPFSSPHHSASTAALLGGGSGLARPGAVSDAAHGVLFLDELFEWRRSTLDALREPMEDGVVRLARSGGTVTYPASFLLIAASNPCPCGPARSGCRCRPHVVQQYRAHLTGPLADRFDLAPLIGPVPAQALAGGAGGEGSAAVAARVSAARSAGARRGHALNATAPMAEVRRTAAPEAVDVLVRAVRRGRLSARGFHRALRVARTCADLAGQERIEVADAHEAVGHRARLDQVWENAA